MSEKRRFMPHVCLSIFVFACSVFINPNILLYATIDIIRINFGLFIISCSIFEKPRPILEKIWSNFFDEDEHVTLKSIFIGLAQFSLIQLFGWLVIISVSPVSDELLVLSNSKYLIDSGTIIQTAATIAALIFSAFQALTTSAEIQYEVRGKIRFDNNDSLYTYLRLILTSGIAVFLAQSEYYINALFSGKYIC
jgi:hypothetical protein